MTMPESEVPELLPVTQEDREAAAELSGEWWRNLIPEKTAEFFREGLLDNNPLVQAFARHRLATRTPFPSDGMRARELLAEAFDEIGPTGYARHIRSGAADWPWTGPALRAIQRSLSAHPPGGVREALVNLLAETSYEPSDHPVVPVKYDRLRRGVEAIAAALSLETPGRVETMREALQNIAAFKAGGPHKPGQIKSEHRAMLGIARAALDHGGPQG